MNSAVSLPIADVASPAARRTTVATALAAIGIVYGDLGTSPLYTYQTIVSSVGGHAPVPVAMGLLSLVVWALIITISLKYCLFVMRAEPRAVGGAQERWLSWDCSGRP
jgi:KUP system potassium uptake protein